jgi:hypothetical protein
VRRAKPGILTESMADVSMCAMHAGVTHTECRQNPAQCARKQNIEYSLPT